MEFQRIVVWQSSDLHNCQRKRQTHSKPVDDDDDRGGGVCRGVCCGVCTRFLVRLRLTTARRLINIASQKAPQNDAQVHDGTE